MGEEDERETCFPALRLPFLHIPAAAAATMDSPEHPSTPPLQTSASVPFQWEEKPGKPRPCSDIILLPDPPAKTLDLPPCKFTKTPSPTTVLDGPYNLPRPKFSSFRFFTDGHDSFDSFSTASPEGTAIDLLLGGKKSGAGGKTKGFFGKFKGGKKEFDGGSCRFSPSSISSSYDSVKSGGGVKLKRNGSFSSSHARPNSHLWTSIYQGIKQVMQWKSNKKSNKEGRE
ncbi:hypothetical protein ACS0TY_019163 [Phlomoides rotata]